MGSFAMVRDYAVVRRLRTFAARQELAVSCRFAFGEQSGEEDTTSLASAVSSRPNPDPVSLLKDPESEA